MRLKEDFHIVELVLFFHVLLLHNMWQKNHKTPPRSLIIFSFLEQLIIVHFFTKYFLIYYFGNYFVATLIGVEVVTGLREAEELRHGEVIAAHWDEEINYILLRQTARLPYTRNKDR